MSRITEAVLLIADSGPDIGLGHVGRLAALGEALGARACFSTPDGRAASWLRRRGHRVENPQGELAFVVLDRRYPVAAHEICHWQRRGASVGLVDDVGEGRMLADVVVDPPTLSTWPPTTARRLCGYEHVLIRREWSEAAERAVERSGVLLSFGGSDPYRLTEPVMSAFEGFGVEVSAITGPMRSRPKGRAMTADPNDYAIRVRQSELLVTSFGHGVLEAISVGTPVISVCVRHDHWNDAEALSKTGLLRVIDARDGLDLGAVFEQVSTALLDPDWRAFVAENGPSLVDREGARRVADVLLSQLGQAPAAASGGQPPSDPDALQPPST